MKSNPTEALKSFHEILGKMVESGASDLHLKTGLPPVVRIQDELRVLSRKYAPLSFEQLTEMAEGIVPQRLRSDFDHGKEIDLAYTLANVGRFRLNVYRYRGNIGLVARHIPFEVRSLDQLGMPAIVKKLATQPRGLILVTGITGSGKSTTVAACLNEWNQARSGHIVTIEDPIEYVLQDKKSIISQREVGLDTENFASGLKSSLRQDPDVIMIGELRDKETIQAALSAAETGHLVISTLHTKDASETVNRIIGVFEPEAQREVRVQFAAALSGIISQRLLPRSILPGAGPQGFVPAVEVLVNTPFVKSCLLDSAKVGQITQAMEQGFEVYGMQTFDQHLMMLVKGGLISREVALENATSSADFELQLRGIKSSDGGKWERLSATNVRAPGGGAGSGSGSADVGSASPAGSGPTSARSNDKATSQRAGSERGPGRPIKVSPNDERKKRRFPFDNEPDESPTGTATRTILDLPGETLELDDSYKKK